MKILVSSSSRFFLLGFALILNFACTSEKNIEAVIQENSDRSWSLSDGIEYPPERPLSRAEDGVLFSDGTLIVADQRYGLVRINKQGQVEPFGNFQEIGYSHNPPTIEGGPNGVHLTPDRRHILTADVFSGEIYKTSVESGTTKIVYSHEYGVNTAIQDSSGAVWFTQSTQNKNEERLFGAIATPIPDGALFRLPSRSDAGIEQIPELVIDGLNFANGFYIDEVNNRFYLSETMSNRVLAFDVDIVNASLSNRTILAQIPTPDNMQLNHDGFLWVASPLSNQILAIDINLGHSSVVFDAQNESGADIAEEGLRRIKAGKGVVDLIPEAIGDMPGLLTGMIIGNEKQPFFVANLGEALIKVSKD